MDSNERSLQNSKLMHKREAFSTFSLRFNQHASVHSGLQERFIAAEVIFYHSHALLIYKRAHIFPHGRPDLTE